MNKQQAKKLTAFIKRFEQEQPVYTIQTEPLTMMPYNYGNAISDFIKYIHTNKIQRSDCYDIEKEFAKNYTAKAWLNSLSDQQVMQCFSLIIRKDRFVDGFIATMINNGTLPALLRRLKAIHEL